MKVATIVGARPQFIKAAAVSRAFLDQSDIEELVVHTGQHFDAGMSDIFFRELGIPKPAAYLDINGGSHGDMTGRMLIALEEYFYKTAPDCVLVYGDTNSTLAGALAAAKMHIPIAHVEAGLRSFNMRMPEEVNRLLTDQISSILFCPTQQALLNLEKEGFTADGRAKVVYSGDVMLDAIQTFSSLALKPSVELPQDFLLATVHRAENTDDLVKLRNLVEGLNLIHSELAPVVLPLHPRTRNAIKDANLSLEVETIDPVGYLEMIWLLQNSGAVLTDSGGLQKEAYFCGKPCITVRDETEWVELVQVRANRLCPVEAETMLSYCTDVFGQKVNPRLDMFGDGRCSAKVVHAISQLQ
ncbi:UDP-GlcNAc3NAcA epimerase [Altererythrobacter xiamenensis]|uniref:UDP-GlcNAc3NAcA epimerase n=1 Tax=Altererythrobacter xiamenensis TaxID=1316679 RepID=A0A1Y6F3B2_9SPHN|nr:UDP-GlcNAc3NAcA epimerase [Altererythrobacter xiamenensis]